MSPCYDSHLINKGQFLAGRKQVKSEELALKSSYFD